MTPVLHQSGENLDQVKADALLTAEPAIAESDFVTIDIFYFLGRLWLLKGRIIGTALLFAAIGYGLSYTSPNLYRSVVRFLPPKTTGNPFLSLTHSSGDEYRAMLTSDSVAEDVIRHQNLMAYFKLSDLEKAKTALRGMSKFTTDQNNFLTITVESKEPTTSAKIANEYFAALYRMTARLSNEESEHRLEFMSGPLQVERTKLNEAEAALQKAQEHTGLVVPGAQAAAGVQQIASLQDRISGLEVQLAALRETSTDANPRVISLRSQISNLQGQLAELQRSGSQVNSMGRLPVSSLEVERAQREVQFHSSTLDALMKALATSSLQENYAPSFALIDPAIVLKTKVAPSRKIWFMVGGILGATLGFLWISVPFFFRQWTRSQAGREQIARLKSGAARTRPSARGNA